MLSTRGVSLDLARIFITWIISDPDEKEGLSHAGNKRNGRTIVTGISRMSLDLTRKKRGDTSEDVKVP
jgi:hypothetical protein